MAATRADAGKRRGRLRARRPRNRKCCSTTRSTRQLRAVTFATFLHCSTADVRERTARKRRRRRSGAARRPSFRRFISPGPSSFEKPACAFQSGSSNWGVEHPHRGRAEPHCPPPASSSHAPESPTRRPRAAHAPPASPIATARRSPGRPPRAKPMSSSAVAARFVRCACGTVVSLSRSVKMRRGQPGVSQKNWRTCASMRTRTPCHGRSSSVRT